METTAGFTCSTRCVKFGSVACGVIAPGGLTGVPVDSAAGELGWLPAGLAADGGRRCGMADGEAAERGAGEQYGGQRRAAPWCCGWLVGLGCGVIQSSCLASPFGHALATRGRRPGWRRRHPRNMRIREVNVPVVQRLNRFHVNELSVTSR